MSRVDNIELANLLVEHEYSDGSFRKLSNKTMVEITGADERQVRKYLTISRSGILELKELLINNGMPINVAAKLSLLEKEKQKLGVKTWPKFNMKSNYVAFIDVLKSYNGDEDEFLEFINSSVSSKNIDKEIEKLAEIIDKIKKYGTENKKQTTGYIIKYSTHKKMRKNVKTKIIKKYKKTSISINKLVSKKKYYVKISTYKKVKGKKYYSSWSKMKDVRIK